MPAEAQFYRFKQLHDYEGRSCRFLVLRVHQATTRTVLMALAHDVRHTQARVQPSTEMGRVELRETVMLLAQASGASFGFVALLLVGSLYFAPSIVACIRKAPDRGSVIVLNTFLGWTLIGWIVSMALAARSRPQPGAPVIVNGGWVPPHNAHPAQLQQR